MPQIAAPSHFKQLRDWSERKHAVLKDYLPAFCRVLSKQAGANSIWYIDGYVGAGIYRDPDNLGAPEACGSPVLAARITQELPYSIQCLNVEGDSENYESLERETEVFTHVTNIHADFNDVVGQVLSRVARAPAFFFLDPFGMKDLPMEGLVDRIAVRTKPTDILLRYATDTVRRLTAAFEKDPKRRDAHARNLDKWFRGQEWREIIERTSGDDRDDALLHYYLQQILSISNGRLKIACSYPIRSIEGVTKYHLVFATGNRLGMKLMSDILFKADKQYDEDHMAHRKQKDLEKRNGQTSMLDLLDPEPVDEEGERINQLKLSILGRGNIQYEFDNLRCILIENGWFARSCEKDVRAACKGLHAEGKIVRISEGRAWSRGIEFIIQP